MVTLEVTKCMCLIIINYKLYHQLYIIFRIMRQREHIFHNYTNTDLRIQLNII